MQHSELRDIPNNQNAISTEGSAPWKIDLIRATYIAHDDPGVPGNGRSPGEDEDLFILRCKLPSARALALGKGKEQSACSSWCYPKTDIPIATVKAGMKLKLCGRLSSYIHAPSPPSVSLEDFDVNNNINPRYNLVVATSSASADRSAGSRGLSPDIDGGASLARR
jgi:hypothetical protein